MSKVPEMFGTMVFDDRAMRDRLPKDIYKKMKRTIEIGRTLDLSIASIVASAMKDWAIEKGATHFTHWFQPMTGITAEKHDSFISPNADGSVIMDFSAKELIKGEPDASSFPSGGLRATFEARGYTAWDPTSYAFVKDGVLYIPSAFCAYGGEVLDKKTPLIRSMEAINIQTLRILRLFGNTTDTRVLTTVGAEQEYFLVDKAMHDRRKDLIYCGRTLFGAKAPKGQEMDDHYFGAIKPRVKAFMHELNEELWKLGVLAKTEHNETAPAQHELAPVFTTSNIATDQNQLTMELMKRVARRHNLCCLLHEKPFAGVNGSGKHNNWSMSTNTGANLLEPGNSPYENAQFLLFLCAVIKAVDEHQDLLRISVANAGNDCRLGTSEAPPAIVSIFLGDELTAILEAIAEEKAYSGVAKEEMEIGVDTLPHFPKDTTDRNRTSPFAFTGNKFEFRMPGSSFSVSGPNFVINTIVADKLAEFADILENASDFQKELNELIRKTIKTHRRIIFNGNNYSDQWVAEAEQRGLLNLKSAPEALRLFSMEKNIRLFERHGILNRAEVLSRQEIMIESYCKSVNIEALTMLEMTRRDIFPAVIRYMKLLADTVSAKRAVSEAISCEVELSILEKMSSLFACISKKADQLDAVLLQAKTHAEPIDCAMHYREQVIAAMYELRAVADEMETLVGSEYWPFPNYGDLLFGV